MLVFENLNENNVAEVADLEKRSFGKYAWSLDLLRGELADEKKHYAVIRVDGKVVAYGGFLQVFDEGDVMNIAVDEAYRRQGYGEAILDRFFSEASKLGINSFTLEVRESNVPAKGLYEKKGFRCAGVRKNYYPDGENACIDWKYM